MKEKIEYFNPDKYKCWLTGGGAGSPSPSKIVPAKVSSPGRRAA